VLMALPASPRVLNLGGNDLSCVPMEAEAFAALEQYDGPSRCEDLTELSLWNRNLQELPADMFAGLPNLK